MATMTQYKIDYGTGKLIPVVNDALDKAHDLPIGTVLQLQGYNDPQYVIIERNVDSWGIHYKTINLDEKTYSSTEANNLKHISTRANNGIQMYFTDEIYTPDMINSLKTDAQAASLKAASKKEQDEAASAARIEQYKKDFAFLAIGGTASRNIKTELTRAFKGVKLSVRNDHGSTVYINWTDGPTTKEVEKITDKYSAGNFDGMTDCYDYSSSDWHIFGSAQYIFTSRNFSTLKMETLRPAVSSAIEQSRTNKNNGVKIGETEYTLYFDGYRFILYKDSDHISEPCDENGIIESILNQNSY